jgi:hypothetical protein
LYTTLRRTDRNTRTRGHADADERGETNENNDTESRARDGANEIRSDPRVPRRGALSRARGCTIFKQNARTGTGTGTQVGLNIVKY